MRVTFAKLSDRAAKLPWPGQPGRMFNPDGENIDADDPFWIACLADGSIVEADPTLSKPTDKPAAKKKRAS